MKHLIPLLVLALPALAHAADLTGPAQVIDGDSLVVAGKEIRLAGIDVPEWDQVCTGPDGKDWKPGQHASAWLRSRIEGKTVSCAPQGRDRHRRIIATCYLDGQDINAHLASAGWAYPYTRYSDRYTAEASAAAQAGLGLWAGKCQVPEDWRHQTDK